MMWHTHSLRKRESFGFTLLEFVVTLAIIGTIAAIIGKPITDFLSARSYIDEESTRQTDADYALARMATAIRAAGGRIECSPDSSTLSVDGETYKKGTNSDELIVKKQETEEVLMKGVDTFSCEEIGTDLRLYDVKLDLTSGDSYQVRAFQRAAP